MILALERQEAIGVFLYQFVEERVIVHCRVSSSQPHAADAQIFNTPNIVEQNALIANLLKCDRHMPGPR